ncbi:MAG: sialate O-acetylesterase [bacterium]
MKKETGVLAGLVLIGVFTVHADVKLTALFNDHMVLQREAPVPVWGTAAVGEKVTVEFADQKKSATAGADGRWLVKLDPLKASAEARVLSVSSINLKSEITNLKCSDVLVGEVWLASGQSNMGSPLFAAHNAAEILPKALDPQLRFFRVKNRTAAEPQSALTGQWETATPDTAKNFSAVAYFFARELRLTQKCPIAILQGAWGGTDIETWISLAGLQQEPVLKKALDRWNGAWEQYQKVVANPQLVTDYEKDLKQWQKEVAPAYAVTLKEYEKAKAAGKAIGPKPQPARPEPSNPDPMGMPSPSRRPSTPTVNFNGVIAPLIPYAIRGVIWYQGENNGGRGMEYRELFPRLIEDWRNVWQKAGYEAGKDFPFLFVQLPSNGQDTSPVAAQGWPWLREAQFMALKVPRTGMAITLDVGDPNNVHPGDKIDVGQRLALLAKKMAYGEKIVASGPLYQEFKAEADGAVRVNFTETGSGLTIGQSPWYATGVAPFPKDKLIGFFIAGEDKKWVEASARIEGNSVVVSCAQVPKPAAVRYGWANSPRCNLYNKEGLPASPFRTDTW